MPVERADTITLDTDEDGYHLIIETDDDTYYDFRLGDPDQLHVIARDLRAAQEELIRGSYDHNGEEAYEITDPKHPRHHDVMSAAHDDAMKGAA